ncbi:hypothetical protein NQ318_017237 [Aromia moschata]|uniref:RNA-directed DNA polymerase n=2 Tax=Aromia moschata TaxID=1265417 RepID=A0AAV8YKU1_9CUCU|nr:hypothetical protein NQ318_017237 [Aromia moschata]
MDDKKTVRRQNDDDKRTVRRQNDDDKRTVKRQKGERKSGDRRTNGDDRRTNDDDKRTVRRQNDDDKRTVKRQKGERKSGDRRTNGDDRRTNDDDKRTETRRRGVIRKFKVVEENKEEIERKLEDTRRQVQKEILEKINGLEHQLHRTSIADSGDYSTSPGIPLQNSTLMQAERSVHKILKPPTYDGQSSWSMYRRQFEAAAKANGWTSQEMATSLVISLRGQALEILQSIPEEQQNDYDRIIGALEIRYGHKYLRQVYQSQIKSRQQRSNESLQEYEADIERLIHLAYPQAPKEFLEQIGIQTFIDGLVDTEMQQALRLGRHTTISDALVAALEFKAAKEASRSYKSRVRQVKFDECQSLQVTLEKIMRELNEIKQSKSLQKETRRCYNCGRIGHLQRFCRDRTRNQSKAYSSDRQPEHISRARISFQIASKRFGKRQLVDARGRVSTTSTQSPKMSVSDKSNDAEREPGHAGTGDVQSEPLYGQHDERVGDIKKQKQVHLRGRHGQTGGVLPVLDSSKDTCNELLMTTTVQVEDEWSSEEMMKSQKKDNDLRLIRNWVKNGVRPTWQEVSRYGTTIKGYWAQWSSLCLRDGLLHRKWESPDGVSAVYQLVLPKARIHQVLEELHSSPSGGHFGVTRTLARVRDRFYWVNCRRDVEEWCKRCDLCSAKKGPKTRSRGKMVQYLSGAPFERVAVDILGPLPVTDRGNKYLMVVMDYFSKWPEAVPLPNQEAETVAEAFIENVIARHGVPLELHSDQGRNFESELWQEVMKIMGIKKTRTTALHPQSNGMVERHNRTICHYLSKFVSENQRDWDKLVPLFLLSYRSSQHESTTYTPSMLTSGREMKLPTDLILGRPLEENQERSLPEFVKDLRERLDRIHRFASEKLKMHSDKMKQRLDTTSTETAFEPGDAVWLYAPKRMKGRSPKLQKNWEGPYTIIKKINDLVYRIQLSPRSKPKVVHLERLARYTGHDPPDWFVVEDPPPRTEDSVIRDE